MARSWKAVFSSVIAVAVMASGTVPQRVSAALYEAQVLSTSASVVKMAPGADATYTIVFKNTGTQTWTNYASDHVSVYTYGPKYRTSVFRHPAWIGDTKPSSTRESVVSPGATGTVSFNLRAPSTAGTYRETFHLAIENTAWVSGGEFTVAIDVSESYGSPATTTPVQPASASGATAPETVSVAANAPRFQTALISAPAVALQPGGSATVTAKFRNTGSDTWRNSGSAFISVYTHGPKYRSSIFRDSSWYGATQPARLLESSVAPGAIGTVSFRVSAPSGVTGSHQETFHLAAESTAWVPGGQFVIPISVSGGVPSGQVAAAPSTPQQAAPSISGTPAPGYKAMMLLVSARQLSLAGGSTQSFRVGFKNVGNTTWSAQGERPLQLSAEAGNAYSFRHASWPATTVAAKLATSAVAPGQLAFFDVTLAAPTDGGSYVPRFTLTAGNDPVEGGTVEIPVQVLRGTTGASIPSFGGLPEASGPRGPNIRVGLFQTRSTITFAADGTYTLINGMDHTAVRQLSGITTVTFDFGTRQYTVTNGSYTQSFAYHVHLRPDDPARTIFEIQSYNDRPSWDPSLNFNRFRGELEVFYSSAADELWVIEELPIEDYMRGLAETSNGSPYEYQKALVTAARTFAYFVQKTGGKHRTRNFDVKTDAGDQVYKGYTSELVRPNVVRAVEDTRGMVVTYEGDVAVTPYFSRSDGRTRSFAEVWGTNHPWLVSVPTPYDAGRTLWGHGVGMSASDAVGRAESGADWITILKYYYRGIELQQRY